MITSLKTSASLAGAAALLCASSAALHASLVENYSDLPLEPPVTYWNGSDGSGSFQSGSAIYHNNYNTEYDSWIGFAYSNSVNGALSGTDAQYTAVTLGGMSTSGTTVPGGTYVVGFYGGPSVPIELTLSAGQSLGGLYLTNSLYTYKSMLEGDAFAKKFGGDDGNDKDWLLLTITGRDAAMNETGQVEVYLADYTFDDNALDYILSDWTFADLSALGIDTQFLSFEMSSSDNGVFGMKTPAYFALGGLAIVPEPMSTALALSALATVFILLRRRARHS